MPRNNRNTGNMRVSRAKQRTTRVRPKVRPLPRTPHRPVRPYPGGIGTPGINCSICDDFTNQNQCEGCPNCEWSDFSGCTSGYSSGGRTRPAPRGRGRRFQGGGHTHGGETETRYLEGHNHPNAITTDVGNPAGDWVHNHGVVMDSTSGWLHEHGTLTTHDTGHDHSGPPPIYGNRGKFNNNNRRSKMRRGGRTRPRPSGKRMARGGRTRGRGRSMARGGRTRPAPRRRAMARGGRTRPAPRRRAMARGGAMPSPASPSPWGGRPTPRRRAMARGGRPAPRGRGRKMGTGGRACGGMNQPPCGGYRRGGVMEQGGKLDFSSGLPKAPACPPGSELGAFGSCIDTGQ